MEILRWIALLLLLLVWGNIAYRIYKGTLSFLARSIEREIERDQMGKWALSLGCGLAVMLLWTVLAPVIFAPFWGLSYGHSVDFFKEEWAIFSGGVGFLLGFSSPWVILLVHSLFGEELFQNRRLGLHTSLQTGFAISGGVAWGIILAMGESLFSTQSIFAPPPSLLEVFISPDFILFLLSILVTFFFYAYSTWSVLSLLKKN